MPKITGLRPGEKPGPPFAKAKMGGGSFRGIGTPSPVSRAQTWLCVWACRLIERTTCALVGHPVAAPWTAVRWCGRCGRAL